jgi:hypothetical protein
MSNIHNGLDYTGASIVKYAERGSISVTFRSGYNQADEIMNFQTDKIEVLRGIYNQCIALGNVITYEIN